MFFLNRTLKRWQNADIITADQINAIKVFEHGRHNGRFQKSLFGLGALAIVIGILALISANWYAIPAAVKLGAHVVINAIIAALIFRSDASGKDTARDVLLLAFMGLTLSCIGLIGQTFHLASNFPAAIVLWMALCTPFMLAYGRTKISLLPWLIGFLAAVACGFHEAVEVFNVSDDTAVLWATTVVMFLPLVLIYTAAYLPKEDDYALPDLLLNAGLVLFVIFVTQSTLMWYDTRGERIEFLNQNGRQFIVLTQFILAGIAAKFIPLSRHDFSPHEGQILRMMYIIGIIISALPIILIAHSSSVMAAISFVVFWLCVGGAAQIIGYPKLVSLSIFLVALRLYIVYIELFGSLLQTGFGLILSGIVLIGLGWGAKRIRGAIEQHVGQA